MCYYTYIICETCNAEQKLPPIFCSKLSSGIICTKFNSIDTVSSKACKTLALVACQQSFDENTAEVRLFDILEAKLSWIDWTTCPCGLSQLDLDNNLSGYSDTDYDINDCNETDYDDVDFDELWREICMDIDHTDVVA